MIYLTEEEQNLPWDGLFFLLHHLTRAQNNSQSTELMHEIQLFYDLLAICIFFLRSTGWTKLLNDGTDLPLLLLLLAASNASC